MNVSAIQFLQRENLRLKQENETLERDKRSLNGYLEILQSIYWVSQTITLEENILDGFNKLLHAVMSVMGAKDGSLSRLNSNTNELTFLAVFGDLQEQLPGHRIKSDVGIAGWVVSNGKPLIVNNPRQDWRFSQTVDEEFGFFTNSILSVPVMKYGQVLGLMQTLNKPGDEFTEADIGLLLTLAQVAVMVLEELQSREALNPG